MPSTQKAILLGLIVGLLGVLAALTPQMPALEETLGLPLLFHLRGTRPAPSDVVVVALDRQSSKAMNLPMAPRKWPRTVHARLIDRLTRAGAKVIVFDLIFNEPQSEATDRALAEAMGRAGNVVLAQSLVDETMPVVDARGRLTASVGIERMVPPIPILAEAALALAPFPVPKVPIKLNRVWTFKPGAGDVPTMPVMAFHIYAWDAFVYLSILAGGAESSSSPLLLMEKKRLSFDGGVGAIHAMHTIFRQLRLPESTLDAAPADCPEPLATQLRSMIRLYRNGTSRYVDFYGPAESIRTVSYHRMMAAADSALESFDLRGKAVFVGQTESYWPRAKDGFYTVYTRPDAVDVSGVEIAATVFANLVENRAVAPPALPVHLAIIFFWGLLMAVISYRLPAAVAGLAALGLAGGYLLAAWHQFSTAGTWYPLVAPLFLITPLVLFSALIWKYRIVNRERRSIRKAFGYYLPNAVVDQLSRNIHAIQSDRKVVYSICLFTDAEKYTNLSESMDPESLTTLMNQYYEAIFKPIRDNDGVVLQVIGDSVLSLWTAAHPDPALRRKACVAALAVAEAVDRFNRREDGHRLPTRIGLHTGEVVLGNIGAMDHFEYRPVGDIVNTASRLEGLNKYLGTRILTSRLTLDRVDGLLTRYMGRFLFVGKSKPVEVYELADGATAADKEPSDAWRSFSEGVNAFQEQAWDRARKAFERAVEIGGPDGPTDFYIKLCGAHQRTPPGEDWDGTIHLTAK